MANYILDNTAADVNIAIGQVLNADTTPILNSSQLVTSGGVKAYVDNQISTISTITTANVVQSVKTDKQEFSKPIAFQDITDLAVTITPRFSNSKLLVQTDISSSANNASLVTFRIVVNNAAVGLGDVANVRTLCTFFGGSFAAANTSSMSYLYSEPVTAGSPLVVKIQAATAADTAAINASSTYDPGFYNGSFRGISQVMVTEIYQ
jgi:hypothetical protein